jgi:hypothetical protein
MNKLGFAEAFATYGAKLRNVQWSVSAVAADGSLVVSLWEHHFKKPKDGDCVCHDRVSRWSGAGNREFRANIKAAFENKQPVRVVITHTPDTGPIQAGSGASKVRKTFSVRPDWIGTVEAFDGDYYAIRFSRVEPQGPTANAEG